MDVKVGDKADLADDYVCERVSTKGYKQRSQLVVDVNTAPRKLCGSVLVSSPLSQGIV